MATNNDSTEAPVPPEAPGGSTPDNITGGAVQNQVPLKEQKDMDDVKPKDVKNWLGAPPFDPNDTQNVNYRAETEEDRKETIAPTAERDAIIAQVAKNNEDERFGD